MNHPPLPLRELPADASRALEEVLGGRRARGRYTQADIDSALPAFVLFVSTQMPVDMLTPEAQELLEVVLRQAGALDADSEEDFNAAVAMWLSQNPVHPELQADLRQAIQPRGGVAARS